MPVRRLRRDSIPAAGQRPGAAVLLLWLLASGGLSGQALPQDLLRRAIAVSGGTERLSQLRAIEWEGSATVHVPGRDIMIRGVWRVLPPDTAEVRTWLAGQDSSSARTLVLAAPRGWLVRDTAVTPMTTAMLIEERHQFYLYSLLRLLPLTEPGVSLSPLPPDAERRPGLLIHRVDRLDVSMYFDSTGRVARLVTRFAAVPGETGAIQDVRLAGEVIVDGAHWFRELFIQRDGQPYFDLHIEQARLPTAPVPDWLPRGGFRAPN